jgi:SAM-dependent methyltransferase
MLEETAPTASSTVAFVCLRCQRELYPSADSLNCVSCGSSWPITAGTPRFASANYFGEVPAREMAVLTQAASASHWEEVVRSRFGNDPLSLYGYAADLNRASWISLLPISPHATVLDVGAGLGAITHALALSYERVVSVEPVSERLEFLRVRVEQESLRNVQLVQTTATLLPFAPGTFDLVVVNGILEWIGEWDAMGSPREAQLRFLRRVRELLKPAGLVMIGIENRIGFPSFLGSKDHNGLRFTNLMPRKIATAYMKLRSPGFYRMDLSSRDEYRTYTYTRAGYRKLLTDAGYPRPEFWWPDPGYNEPYALYRLADAAAIRAHLKRQQNEAARASGSSLRGLLRHWLLVRSGLFRHMVPDFLIFASKDHAVPRPPEATTIPDVIASALRRRASRDLGPVVIGPLLSSPFRNKHAAKLCGVDGTTLGIAKIANVGRPDAQYVRSGFENLSLVWRTLVGANAPLQRCIPEPIELLRVGNAIVSLERAVAGTSLEELAMERAYMRGRDRVRRHLQLISEWIVSFQSWATIHLSENVDARIPAEWIKDPIPLPDTIQHGDLFPGNIFVSEGDRSISVIDWDGLALGYPPLFDFFSAVTGLAHPSRRLGPSEAQTWDGASLAYTFCETNWFSEHVLKCSWEVCAALKLPKSDLARYFAQYLAVRAHQFAGHAHCSGSARVFDGLSREVYEGSIRSIFER